MMWLRIACLRAGYDVVPLIIPVAVLMSMVVAQIRFAVLLPVTLLTLGGIVGAELWFLGADGNRVFNLTGAVALVVVGLSPAYALEWWARSNWQRQTRLREFAQTDALTGLPNRRHFDTTLKHSLRIAARQAQPVALMILDIDHFKAYNDRYGHPQGDVCLRAVGQYLQQQIRRPDDFAGRVGGEEFTVVWVDADPQSSLIIQHADTVRDGISRLLLSATEPHTTMTASAGLALLQVPKADAIAYARAATELIARADAALYKAKNNNRNQLVMADTPA